MRTSAATLALLVALTLAPTLGSAAGPSCSTWQHAGTTLQYVGTSTAHAGDVENPLNWLSLGVGVTQVDAHDITLSLVGSDAATVHNVVVTYDLATRKEIGGDAYAYLWVNPSDIAAGRAQIGDHTAVVTLVTPTLVELSDGQADYWYDHASGVLVRAENAFDPGAAQLVSSSR